MSDQEPTPGPGEEVRPDDPGVPNDPPGPDVPSDGAGTLPPDVPTAPNVEQPEGTEHEQDDDEGPTDAEATDDEEAPEGAPD
ncbi:MAG: hypothetical protein PGN07_06985 [Aeromicrobium erythreum]